MKKVNINSKQGFTIIEVVLVLAIAGLIFLMVFVALPNLQRTQRDTQRRNNLDRLSTSLTQYITNNNTTPGDNNNPPTTTTAPIAVTTTGTNALSATTTNPWGKFAFNYLLSSGGDTFVDPNGGAYGLMAYNCTNTNGNCQANNNLIPLNEPFNNRSAQTNAFNNTGIMVVMTGAQCGPEVESQTFVPVNGARSYAVAVRLESNGIYCVDNRYLLP